MVAKKKANKKKAEEEKAAPFSNILGDINKGLDFSAVVEMDGADCTTKIHRTFLTGIHSLDMAFGGPGFASGRLIEVFGPEAMLKSAIALRLSNAVAKEGGVVYYNDGESALNQKYVWQERHLRPAATRKDEEGNDTWPAGKPRGETNFFLINPTYVEDLRQLSFKAIKQFRKHYPVNRKDPANTVPMFMVFDSVPAMRARDQLHDDDLNKRTGDGEQDARGYPLVAGVLSSWLPELAQVCSREQVTCLFINQIRQKLNAGLFEDPNVTVGGKALKFFSSYRIYLRSKKNIKRTIKDPATGKTGPTNVGFLIRAEFVKNKLNPGDMQKLSIPCFKRIGIKDAWCIKTFFEDLGLIVKKGSVSHIKRIGEKHTWRGDNQWIPYAKKHWQKLVAYADALLYDTVDKAFEVEDTTDFTHLE